MMLMKFDFVSSFCLCQWSEEGLQGVGRLCELVCVCVDELHMDMAKKAWRWVPRGFETSARVP